MADNIIKLKVDSDEYQGKIKRASEGLQALGRSLHDAGKTFADADEKQVKFAKELGNMQTVSNTARGKISELSAAFVNLKSDYLNMTEAEKQSPIGQAMAKSLDELKNRTIAAKQELEDLNKELNGMKTTETSSGDSGGGLFGGDKLSGMLQVFGGNLMTKGFELASSAAMTFVNTIKDAAAQGIEMAKSGEGVRIAFERLNQPGLLDNLRESTHGTVTNLELMKAAVKFNDFKLPLDELGTMLAFAQQKAKDTGQSVDYMVDSIVTGLGRKSLMILDNLGLSAAEIKDKMAETGDMTKAVGAIIREQMESAGEYTSTAADRATAAQVNLQNAMEEFGRTLLPLQEQGVTFWNELEIGAIKFLNNGLKEVIPGLIELKGDISDLYDVAVNNPWTSGLLDWLETGLDISTRFLPYISKIREILDAIKGAGGYKMDGSIGGAIQGAIKTDTITEIPDVVITGHRRAKTTRSTAKSTPEPFEGSIDAQTKKVQDLQKAWRAAADDDSRKKIKDQIEQAQTVLDVINGKTKLTDITIKADTSEALEKLKGIEGITIDQKDVTIKADTSEALAKIQDIDGITITPKKVKFEVVDMKSLAPNGLSDLIPDTFTRQQQGLTELKQKVKLDLDAEALKADTETLKTILKDAIQNGITGMDFQLMGLGDEIAKGFDIPDEKWKEIIEKYNEKLKEQGLGPINVDLKTSKTEPDNGKDKGNGDSNKTIVGQIQNITSGVQGIFSGIEQLGIELPEELKGILNGIQGVMSILTSISTLITAIETLQSAQTLKFWSNGGVVHAATGLIVPGNNMSGDMVPSMINSGELILNKAQQGNLASQLQDNERGGGYTPSHVSGEQIWIAVNNFTRRTGRGELVTWK